MNEQNNCSNKTRQTSNPPFGVIEILGIITFIGIVVMMFIPSKNSDYVNPVESSHYYSHKVK